MEAIDTNNVQTQLDKMLNHDLYLHLETTNGAYASHRNEGFLSAGANIRNGKVKYSNGQIKGTGPFRVGLQIELGWIYAEGLTHWELNEKGQLLLAGHDADGKLAVSLQLSKEPF